MGVWVCGPAPVKTGGYKMLDVGVGTAKRYKAVLTGQLNSEKQF